MNRLTDIYYDLRNGIRGILYWLPFAWKWRSWDYVYGLDALAHHFKALEEDCRTGHHTCGERDAKQIRVALFLLKRLREDNYYENAFPECRRAGERDVVDRWVYQEKQDWNYLFEHMRKHMRRWWN